MKTEMLDIMFGEKIELLESIWSPDSIQSAYTEYEDLKNELKNTQEECYELDSDNSEIRNLLFGEGNCVGSSEIVEKVKYLLKCNHDFSNEHFILLKTIDSLEDELIGLAIDMIRHIHGVDNMMFNHWVDHIKQLTNSEEIKKVEYEFKD